jgi:hypothetical protein
MLLKRLYNHPITCVGKDFRVFMLNKKHSHFVLIQQNVILIRVPKIVESFVIRLLLSEKTYTSRKTFR